MKPFGNIVFEEKAVESWKINSKFIIINFYRHEFPKFIKSVALTPQLRLPLPEFVIWVPSFTESTSNFCLKHQIVRKIKLALDSHQISRKEKHWASFDHKNLGWRTEKVQKAKVFKKKTLYRTEVQMPF